MLDQIEQLHISPDELERLAREGDEWFYNLEVRVETPRFVLAFGVQDSTALFVSAPEELAQPLLADFRAVVRASDN